VRPGAGAPPAEMEKVRMNRTVVALSASLLTIVALSGQTLARPDPQSGPDDTAGSANDLERGQQIAQRTQQALGSNLMRALSEGGPVNAIEFCSERALPITAEMSAELGAVIQRVTDQPRNPANAAEGAALAYIEAAKADLESGTPPRPVVQNIDGQTVAFYPIMTQGLCLQCHGTPGAEISEATLAAINEKYPGDQATGYGPDELRGIWKITLREDQAGPAH
jgi:hypothetical protein